MYCRNLEHAVLEDLKDLYVNEAYRMSVIVVCILIYNNSAHGQ